MNTRILEIMQYKTNGKQAQFAALMGWSPPYLSKLLRGENLGLQPILTILSTLPEINARWFLFGEGTMLSEHKVTQLRCEVSSRVQAILNLERFIVVMSPSQLNRYKNILTANHNPDFNANEVARLQQLLDKRTTEINQRISDAISKATH